MQKNPSSKLPNSYKSRRKAGIPISLCKTYGASGLKAISSKGFTLIEMLVVIGVLGLVAFSALGALRGARGKAALQDSQATILHAFEIARSRAATGVGSSDHGVRVESNKIVSFEGATYPGSGNETLFEPGISTNITGTDFIFKRLSGRSSASSTVVITGVSGTSTVAVTYDGTINPR